MNIENQLPVQLQLLNNFIYQKPQIVVELLKKNGVQVSNKPTLPEIIRKSLDAINDANVGFINDTDKAIATEEEKGFVFTAISIGLSIGSAIMGASQAKKMRRAMLNAKLMELAVNEKLAFANIQAMKEKARIEIMTNTLLQYGISLQGEATKRQRDTGLFVGIMGVSLAIVYASIQIFK